MGGLGRLVQRVDGGGSAWTSLLVVVPYCCGDEILGMRVGQVGDMVCMNKGVIEKEEMRARFSLWWAVQVKTNNSKSATAS